MCFGHEWGMEILKKHFFKFLSVLFLRLNFI